MRLDPDIVSPIICRSMNSIQMQDVVRLMNSICIQFNGDQCVCIGYVQDFVYCRGSDDMLR